MNELIHSSSALRASVPLRHRQGEVDALRTRFALRVASSLSERSSSLDSDVTERLRVAREMALDRARASRHGSGSGRSGEVRRVGRFPRLGARLNGWQLKFAPLLAVVALAGGLLLIQYEQDATQISVAAEVDTALLADDLPPTAYGDPGFAEFLKTPGE